jgi:hypothetical protein
MKQKDRLTSRLYIIATIAFYGAVLFSAYIIICDVFVKPTDSFFTVPNHNYGYTVPVDIQLNKPGDSTLIYHNADHSKSGQIITAKQYSTENRQGFKRILKDSSFSKIFTIDSLIVRDDNLKPLNSEFDNVTVFRASGYAVLNPKDIGFKLLLAIKDYLFLFAVLYTLWLTRSFFKSLNNEFSFNSSASRKLLIIGNVILCYQLINWIFCLIIKQSFLRILVESVTPATGSRIEMYTLYADTEFNLGLILLSLSLIVISKLFDKGYNLQQENDLTI